MITFYQNSNAVCSKVNKVIRQFLTLIRVEYVMSRANREKKERRNGGYVFDLLKNNNNRGKTHNYSIVDNM